MFDLAAFAIDLWVKRETKRMVTSHFLSIKIHNRECETRVWSNKRRTA